MGLGENGKLAFAHKSHDAGTWDATAAAGEGAYTGSDPNNKVTAKSNYIAGEYSIGGMTAYLGFAQHKTTDKSGAAELAGAAGTASAVRHIANKTDKTTFAGIRGSVGDTGVSYLFQARSKKSKGTVEVGNAGHSK